MSSLAWHEETSPQVFTPDCAPRASEPHAVAKQPLELLLRERHLLSHARDFLARPSKAFRARLIESCFVLAGGAPGSVPQACLDAIELLHGGSLIIDDIQDGSETRRGAPSLHRLVGTPQAINTGNWLYFVALSRLHELEVEPARGFSILRAAHACLVRCHEGQALDLGVRVSDVKGHELSIIARTTSALKTGALVGFAARLGAEVANAPADEVLALADFGERIGIALQMLDDLGSFAAPARRAKALEDLRLERVTWVWSWARETLDDMTFRMLARSLSRAEEHASLCERLAEASESLGRARARGAIEEACSLLRARFANRPALDGILTEVARLETSYG
jgi:geranylgeranyl pyrophosphate synthase